MKKLSALLMAVCLISFWLTGCDRHDNSKDEVQTKYVIYCSLNDEQTETQKLSVEEAQKMARKVITDRGLGFTEYVAYGGFVDGGKINGNDTLVYTFFFIEKSDAESIAAELKDTLSLTSVLMDEINGAYGFVE